MQSKLKRNSLQINSTQEISGIYTTLNNNNSQVPTSAAVITFLRNKGVQPFPPTSLEIEGDWAHSVQYAGNTPDPSGLTFIATFSDGAEYPVTEVSVRPVRWNNVAGQQTATFYYTISGVTVTATKTANILPNSIQLDQFQVDNIVSNIDFIF